MYPHRIRLLGPWDCEPITLHQPPQHVTPPMVFHTLGLRGQIRLTRRFGYPGRIDFYEHVWLTFADLTDGADIALNETVIGVGMAGAFEAEVTPLLAQRNCLEIVLDARSETAGLGEVALEVRRDAFLRGVRAAATPDGTIRVTGSVVGHGQPLDLYALGGGQTVYYSPTEAATEGKSFDFVVPSQSPVREMRVELVCGAEQWYVVELPISKPES